MGSRYGSLLLCLACLSSGVLITYLPFIFDTVITRWFNYSGDSLRPQPSLLISIIDSDEKKNFNVALLPQRSADLDTVESVSSLLPETQIALKLAWQMKAEGKRDKAFKIIQQCKALVPHHPDVLNQYGEFLEDDDIIEAEHHYALALVFQPGHHAAAKNRKRLLPRVQQLDMEMLRRIEKKREALIKIPEGNMALKRAKLEAYFKHIYHSNAIEGNTMTLSMTRSIVESGIAVGGKSVVEHNEVLGLDAALKYINNTLLSRYGMVGVEEIQEIHRRVLGYVDPFEAGKFRNTQVFVGDFVPPPPTEVDLLMAEFGRWLQSKDALLLHPIELAALAHYKLVYIHPFTDGNGRTSRLLMNLFMMQAGYPPVIIKKEQRFQYYDYLKQANWGDVRPFIRFVARCTEETLDEYLASVTILPKAQGKLLQTSSDVGGLFFNEAECLNPFKENLYLTEQKCSKNNE